MVRDTVVVTIEHYMKSYVYCLMAPWSTFEGQTRRRYVMFPREKLSPVKFMLAA